MLLNGQQFEQPQRAVWAEPGGHDWTCLSPPEARSYQLMEVSQGLYGKHECALVYWLKFTGHFIILLLSDHTTATQHEYRGI